MWLQIIQYDNLPLNLARHEILVDVNIVAIGPWQAGLAGVGDRTNVVRLGIGESVCYGTTRKEREEKEQSSYAV